jgi:hypothetical protein
VFGINLERNERGVFQATSLGEFVVLGVLNKLKYEPGATSVYILCQAKEDQWITL